MSSVTNTNQDKVYLDYKDKITAYVRSRIENKYDVEDIVSTVFLKIYQKIDSFDESKASLSTWIYTITRNTVIDYFREIKTHIEFLDEIEADTLSADSLVDDELLEDLAYALETLSERERDLIILHYYKGYTLKKIAEMMQMSYINAKVVHSKALKQLGLRMRSDGSL